MLPLNQIIQADALTTLQQFEADAIDLLTTDPPYGYNFMNKDWDKAVVNIETWRECLRVLKPGAFAFIMSSPRQDVLSRMICNLQDAGFRTDFTSLYHTYASGFPKAKNLKNGSYAGFQPKPAVEVVLVVMKPLSEKSFTDQALANGKGVTWLDNCRVNGRFPANLLVSDSALGGDYSRYFSLDKWFDTTFPFLIIPKASKAEKNRGLDQWIPKDMRFFKSHNGGGEPIGTSLTYPDGTKRPINKMQNFHPTVKPIKLMSYLIMLGSRPNDIVLDPFVGSGTTCISAQLLKRQWIGIESNPDYVKIARTKIKSFLINVLL